jgi:hypothetical protein
LTLGDGGQVSHGSMGVSTGNPPIAPEYLLPV